MAPIHDIEVEGVTTFTETPTTSYRYVLKLKRDKLSIWMEDRTRGALRVVLDFKFRFLRLERSKTFQFVLDPVSMKQIDVLELKLRDQQDELERHRGELEREWEELVRLRGETLAHVELKASTKHVETCNILWNDIKSVTIAVNSETGEVSTQRPGIYSLVAMVQTQASWQN
ncbi:hypothetical protein PsorP6_015866 [Peronosclerospora sorghi]|uniref:Uncharacterized protein n=1 Tax=Peronosclerospora sorghi TaxID=230839 RepID=A0ACC0WLT2_9STRA|nr:hypothetical protein PsorP6_015866 [Peronosclerospora sorghi]